MEFPDQQFLDMREVLKREDAAREQVIRDSRTLLKDAKHAVYEAHAGNLLQASALVEKAKQIKLSLEESNEECFLLRIGAFLVALEEYAEAACFVAFVSKSSLPSFEDLGVPLEAYLGGLSDMTGELARLAIFSAIERDSSVVKEIWSFVSRLQSEMLHFHLRNSPLRKKSDAIKYNLQKIEQTLYDLEIHAK